MSSTSGDKKFIPTLDESSGIPFYRQIIKEIERAIVSGRLSAGDRLPTIRSLAIELKMNPNTIAKAYAELELRGLVKTQVGSGTYVASSPGADVEERLALIDAAVERCVRELEALGVGRSEMPDLFRNR